MNGDTQVDACEDGYKLTKNVGNADTCDRVDCEAHATRSGTTGCTCNSGYWGTIVAVAGVYSGSCTACTDVTNAKTGAMYTCTSADNSEVFACKNGYKKMPGAVPQTCVILWRARRMRAGPGRMAANATVASMELSRR